MVATIFSYMMTIYVTAATRCKISKTGSKLTSLHTIPSPGISTCNTKHHSSTKPVFFFYSLLAIFTKHARSEVLTALLLKIQVFWDEEVQSAANTRQRLNHPTVTTTQLNRDTASEVRALPAHTMWLQF
jgi:hypothetical protein